MSFLSRIRLDTIRSWVSSLFALDSDTVHKTNDEIINGIKIFKNSYDDTPNQQSSDNSHSIIVRTNRIRKGTNFTTLTYDDYTNIIFQDNEGSLLNHDGRFASMDYCARTTGQYELRLSCFKNQLNNHESSFLNVGYDNNGIQFASCTSTDTTRIVGQDIITRDFIPKDTRIVHTSGTDIIDGVKEFVGPPRTTCTDGGGIVIRNPYIVRGTNPSKKQYMAVSFCDSSGDEFANGGAHGRIGLLETCADTAGNVNIYLSAYKNTANNGSVVSLLVGYPASGDPYVKPGANGTVLLGASNARWKEIWCTQTSINSSSDERLKSEIEAIPDDVLDAWSDIQYTQFHFKDSVKEKGVENSRLHTGLIAQRVSEKLLAKGIDPEKYGFYLHDSWEAEPEEKNDEGIVIKEAAPAGDSYGLRYTEVLCIEAAYQRRRADRLEQRVTSLEKELHEIKEKLKNLNI